MGGVGIIGAGGIAEAHARAIASVPGLRLVASCRRSPDASAAFASAHGCRAYTDWRALLHDPEVRIVAITTPHHLHAEIAVAAARAGRHILIEKPMAPDLAACDAIVAAVEAAGVSLLVGHTMHFTWPAMVARRMIQAGDLGRPIAGRAAMVKLWMSPSRQPWHLDEASGGGMLLTAGLHALDLLIWLMGRPVVGVTAMSGTLLHEQQAEDSTLIGLRFEDGGFGQVASLGYRAGAETRTAEVVCERGVLRVDPRGGVALGRGERWQPVPGSDEPDAASRALEREWAAMAAMLDGAPAPVSVSHARHVIAVIEAARQAARERREIVPA